MALQYNRTVNAERLRLEQTARKELHWRRWGPYLSAREWGTVREDYSADGTAWDYFPHEHARSRAYRWGEDGLLGICDNHQRLCFALALWNERDPILKERLFGLNGHEGNHGEDVKEYYYYLDSTPTHSYMKALYKYPQGEYPYSRLVDENRRRGKHEAEFELIDTGLFDEDRYFDVVVEYAKADIDDILIRLSITNRGPETANVHVLPTLWFRNLWAWGETGEKPRITKLSDAEVALRDPTLGQYYFSFDNRGGDAPPELLFTDNETNLLKVFGSSAGAKYSKDAFHRRIIQGEEEAVNPEQFGTKACGWYRLSVDSQETQTLRLRLTRAKESSRLIQDFDGVFARRIEEADHFYDFMPHLSADAKRVERQAFAGLLWSKQYFHYVVEDWLNGDPGQPTPPASRKSGRNREWTQLFNEDIVSMPDNWEYPWYAAWDLAFHMIPLSMIDPDFAKSQLGLFLREWYMHPNGQLPAYEWNFSDVNPPVHAWACWRVFKIDQKLQGKPDYAFLESVFHKLLMNFTWWVNRKDAGGNNIFEGGFLGLDNIGVFDRSAPLPTGGYIEQSDGTSWMAMYCLNMLKIAMELATVDLIYEDVASKFFEHYLHIAKAINSLGETGLWHEEDGFFYDRLRLPDGQAYPMKVRSLVGLIPLYAMETLEQEAIDRLPGFKKRMEWFIQHRPDMCDSLASLTHQGVSERRLLSLVQRDKLVRVLRVMLDESEFLSPHGIRSLSKVHAGKPYLLDVEGTEYRVDYEPAESRTGLFGGNSNWRGPIWFPVNFLLIETLQKYHHYYGDDLQVEYPTGSGRLMNLSAVATELSRRLSHLFIRGEDGKRAIFGRSAKFQEDANFRDHILFYEYFHADNGAGLGASHQTGWTGLVAKLLQQSGE